MARPRTPTAVLDARGSFDRHPERRRDGEPEVKEPLCPPPDYLNDSQRKAWHEIVARAPLGVLTQADTHAVEVCAKLLADSRDNWDKFSIAAVGRLQSMLGAFGMTPSERARLSIGKAEDANPFDDLVR